MAEPDAHMGFEKNLCTNMKRNRNKLAKAIFERGYRTLSEH